MCGVRWKIVGCLESGGSANDKGSLTSAFDRTRCRSSLCMMSLKPGAKIAEASHVLGFSPKQFARVYEGH